MMEPQTSEIRAYRLLKVIYDRTRDQNEPIFVTNLAQDTGLSTEELQAAWRYLKDKGLIRTSNLRFTAQINSAGIHEIEDKMNLAGQCNETITVERQDGSRYENVPALVTGKTILIPDPQVPIAPNDAVLRQLPSGLVERLIVTDPGFRARIHGLPAHYQVKYRPQGQESDGKPGYVFHLSGNNSRVNIQSTDNSVNSVIYQAEDMAKLAEEFAQLRSALLPLAHDAEHFAAIGAVASAEIAAKDGESSKITSALSSLGTGGKWVLGVAKDIGVPLAVAALQTYLGFPPG
jgi:hypothetical protein